MSRGGNYKESTVTILIVVIAVSIILIVAFASQKDLTVTNGLTSQIFLGIVNVIATCALVIYAGVQIRMMRKERAATVLLEIMKRMEKIRPERHKLYKLCKHKPDHKKWNAKERERAYNVGVGLQQVAYLAEVGLIPREYLFENYAQVFVDCWKKLEGSIEDLRRETVPSQREHLEKFAKRCEDYLQAQRN